MAYIEIKTINGRKYKYLRESIRIGDRVIHKNIKYFGSVKNKKTKKWGV